MPQIWHYCFSRSRNKRKIYNSWKTFMLRLGPDPIFANRLILHFASSQLLTLAGIAMERWLTRFDSTPFFRSRVPKVPDMWGLQNAGHLRETSYPISQVNIRISSHLWTILTAQASFSWPKKILSKLYDMVCSDEKQWSLIWRSTAVTAGTVCCTWAKSNTQRGEKQCWITARGATLHISDTNSAQFLNYVTS